MSAVSFRRMPESRGFHPARRSLESGVATPRSGIQGMQSRRNDGWDVALDRMIP